jgi:hypothetical protein
MKKKRFCIEALEARSMLAGDIILQQSGDSLIVTGDDMDNNFSLIRDDVGQLVATGFAGTTLNGGAGPLNFTGINNITVYSKGGNDFVTIDNNNIPLKGVVVDLGAGDDVFEINRTALEALYITGGDGNDGAFIGITFLPNITTQAGLDAAIQAGSVGVNTLNFDGGDGNDQFFTTRVFGGGNWNIGLGAGNDVYDSYWTSSGALNINGSSGDDSISIGYHVSNGVTTAQGSDGNDLLSVVISNFKRDASFSGGNGYDTVAIDTNYFERNLTIDSGNEADTIVLAANVIEINATILSGNGDDNVRIGRRYDNSQAGNIIRQFTQLDTGSGKDTLILSVNDLRSFFGDLGSDDDNATVDYNRIDVYGILNGGSGFNLVTRNANTNLNDISFNN